MAYFPNGTAGMMYEEQYCSRCIHDDAEHGCAVMIAHNLYNYEECNNENSILHLLIPRSKGGLGNEQCRMFWPRSDPGRDEVLAGRNADQKYREWKKAREHA